MQHIQEIRLQNVRKFEDATFTFKPGFNLLVGENGVGKSTLLKALRTIPNEISKRPSWRYDEIRLGSNEMQISHVIIQKDKSPSPWTSRQPARDSSKNETEHAFSYKKRSGGRASNKDDSIGTEIYFLGPYRPLIPSLKYKGSKINSDHITPASRDQNTDDESTDSGHDFTQSSMISLSAENANSSNDPTIDTVVSFTREALSSLNSSYKKFIRRDLPFEINCGFRSSELNEELISKKHQSEQRAVQDWLYKYFREDPSRIPLNLGSQITLLSTGHMEPTKDYLIVPDLEKIIREIAPKLDGLMHEVRITIKTSPRIAIQTEKGELLLEYLSDGEKRILSLIMGIAELFRMRGGRPTPRGNEIVLIDEIDLHLHPKWQREIVKILIGLFPGCQFIATTHSPFVIQSIDHDQAIKVTPTGQREIDPECKTIDDIAEWIQGVDMPQRSRRAEKLSVAAENYFSLLKEKPHDDSNLKKAEKAYREASEPFTSNPALHALLRVEQLQSGER